MKGILDRVNLDGLTTREYLPQGERRHDTKGRRLKVDSEAYDGVTTHGGTQTDVDSKTTCRPCGIGETLGDRGRTGEETSCRTPEKETSVRKGNCGGIQCCDRQIWEEAAMVDGVVFRCD